MTSPHTRIAQAALLFAIWLLTVDAGAQTLQTLQLQHRTAEELMPLIEPLLRENDAITGRDYTLFIRTDAQTLAQVKTLLAQVDRKARQLLVSVRRGDAGVLEREGVTASGALRGDQTAVAGGVKLETSGARARHSDSGTSSVAVLEGHTAHVSTGTTMPVVTVVAGGRGRSSWGVAATEYRDVGSGFLITPRIAGDSVVLNVEQGSARPRGDGNIDTQRLSTQVRAGLGEWIQLGGVAETSTTTRSGIATRQHSTSDRSSTVWVKVEEIPNAR